MRHRASAGAASAAGWIAACAVVLAALDTGAPRAPQTPPDRQHPQATRDGQTPQAAPDQQKPTFRTEVNFVRVDVYARANGRPVGDLEAGDVQVLEDGIRQTISTFEHIVIRGGTPPAERVEPRNVRESNQMAADPRNRLFVLFLDTFHVTDTSAPHVGSTRMPGDTTARMPQKARMAPPMAVDRALSNLLRTAVGPDDLVAAMTPEMEPGALSFVRRPESIEAFLKTEWARRYSLDNLSPEQERYFVCYPPVETTVQSRTAGGRFDGIAEAMVLREREAQTLRALEGLVRRLGELREERKGVLLVSEGWELFGRDERLARRIERLPAPLPPDIHVGAGGKLAAGTDPRAVLDSVDWQQCEAARVRLANLNHPRDYRTLLDEANRANVSFYPVDPRGLAVFDVPIDYQEISEPTRLDPGPVGVRSTSGDLSRLQRRLETLRTAASATDGMAAVTSNDLAGAVKQLVDDLSDYYLIGYYSTNTKTDGSIRRIEVRTARPGVQVRSRGSYRAATLAEVAARAAAAARPDPGTVVRERALASLDRVRAGRPVRVTGGLSWAGAPDAAGQPRPLLWVLAELDAAAARSADWAGGARAALTVMAPDGRALWDEEAAISPPSMAVVRYLADTSITTGEHIVRVRVRGAGGAAADITEQVRIAVPAPGSVAEAPPGDALVFRSGPFTGRSFQPTADARFRRSERIRVDAALPWPDAVVTARLLDRKGQALAVPVTSAVREQDGFRFASAEVALAPLAPADYLVELSLRRGQRTDTVLAPFRIVP